MPNVAIQEADRRIWGKSKEILEGGRRKRERQTLPYNDEGGKNHNLKNWIMK